MLNRRIVGLLAVLLALGAVSAIAMPRAGRSAETWAITCLSEQQCKQHKIGRRARAVPIAAGRSASLFYRVPKARTPKISRHVWRANYQRPPTRRNFS